MDSSALRTPYRGSTSNRPGSIALPPQRMPLLHGGRLLKQWRYVSIWSEQLSLCAGSVRVGPTRQEFWAVWDRQNRRLWEHTRLWTGRVRLPRSRVMVEDGDVSINVWLEENEGFEVVTPVGRAYTWTRKQCGISAHGTVRVGETVLPVDAVALIDDNAGYHPRHTSWYWSGGAGTDSQGRTVTWSVITGLNDSPRNSERTLWVDGVPSEVGPVEFTPDLSRVCFSEGGELRSRRKPSGSAGTTCCWSAPPIDSLSVPSRERCPVTSSWLARTG